MGRNTLDIVFLISHIPNPRMNKRIAVSKEVGQTALISLDRKTYNLFNIQHKDIKNIIITMSISGTKPIRRIFKTINFGFKAINHLRRLKPKCIYVGNLDMLFISYLYSLGRKTNIIYEVGDLNRLIIDTPKKIKLKIFKKLLTIVESKLCKKINNIVVTSEKFYDLYYSKFLPLDKVLVIPNVPDRKAIEGYKVKEDGIFTIGFIGGIRYINQMKMMVDVAGKLNINVIIAGAGFSANEEDDFRRYCEKRNYVHFTGRYNYMEDIAELYSKCDCIYSVYDADLNNVKVALPNKLYESIYCNLPIIVAKGTYLGELVEDMGVGVAVSHKVSSELEEVLSKMIKDKNYYNSFVEACNNHKDILDIEMYNSKLSKRIFDLINAN
jgi:succinoglycan biosynthesis protein ExoL